MTRRLAFASLVSLVGLIGCGVPAQDNAELADDADVPFDLLDEPTTTAPAESPASPSSTIELCFVRDDELAPTRRPTDDQPTLAAVVEMLVTGPSPAERTAGLTSALPERAVAADVETSRGTTHVELTEVFTALTGRRQLLAVAQIVCTLTSRAGIGQVAFTLDGEPVDIPRGDGSTTSEPVTADDYQQL